MAWLFAAERRWRPELGAHGDYLAALATYVVLRTPGLADAAGFLGGMLVFESTIRSFSVARRLSVCGRGAMCRRLGQLLAEICI